MKTFDALRHLRLGTEGKHGEAELSAWTDLTSHRNVNLLAIEGKDAFSFKSLSDIFTPFAPSMKDTFSSDSNSSTNAESSSPKNAVVVSALLLLLTSAVVYTEEGLQNEVWLEKRDILFQPQYLDFHLHLVTLHQVILPLQLSLVNLQYI